MAKDTFKKARRFKENAKTMVWTDTKDYVKGSKNKSKARERGIRKI